MKRVVVITLGLSVCLIFLSSSSALGQEKNAYVAVKAGVFGLTGDLDDAEFDPGFNGEVAYEPGLGFISGEEDDEVTVIPVTVTAKEVLPADMFELYLGAGLDWYFTNYDAKASVGGVVLDIPFSGTGSFDDDDSVFGARVVVGILMNIAENFFFGVEGKYIWTDDAKVEANHSQSVERLQEQNYRLDLQLKKLKPSV